MLEIIATYLKEQPAGVVMWAALVAAVAYFGPKALRVVRRLGHGLDDVLGHPARDGVPEKPGLLKLLHTHGDQLTSIKTEVAAHGEQLAAIKGEVEFNHGGSLKDAVVGARADVTEVERRVNVTVATLTGRMDSLEGHVHDLVSLLTGAGHSVPPPPRGPEPPPPSS